MENSSFQTANFLHNQKVSSPYQRSKRHYVNIILHFLLPASVIRIFAKIGKFRQDFMTSIFLTKYMKHLPEFQ